MSESERDSESDASIDVGDVPEISNAREFASCPRCDDPADAKHNCRTTSKVVVREDDKGDETLQLWLHLKCTCGHELERVIG